MRKLSWLLLPGALIAAIATIGAAALTYFGVRQMVVDSPVDMPALQIGANVAPTSAPLFGLTRTPAGAQASINPPTSEPGNPASIGTQGASAPSSAGQATATIPPLTDPGRVTILVLGIDQRHGEKGPFRTDTIIVASIDPVRHTAALLSIPRDIYLPIPVFGVADRINNANAIGELGKYPGGGPKLAVKTVESLIGVPIQRYVMINFDVFDTVIDAIGPIQVCPTTAIHDTQYPDGSYGVITVDFQPGCQNLDSTRLLEYSRVRHNAGDDFGRAARQQEVIRAVREKILSLGGVSALIGKAGSVWQSVQNDVQTDLNFAETIQLAQVAQSIPKENIQSVVITDRGGYLIPSTLNDGSQVFTPVYEKIHDLVAKLFNADPGSAPIDAASNPASMPAAASAAAIRISNGAGVDGMAKSTADKLRAKGFNIVDAQNADTPGGYARTVIRVYNSNLFNSARDLAVALGLDGTVISAQQSGPPGIDIEVVIGKDIAPTATPTS